MNKAKLISFIGKYNLGGSVESVKLVVRNKVLTTDIMSVNKTMVGSIRMNGFDLENSEIGINETSKFKSLLNILNDNIELSLDKTEESKVVSVELSDGETHINFALSELEIIPKVSPLKKEPIPNLEIPLTKEFISKFIKATSALSEAETFTILEDNNKIKVIIGYSGQINSNRVSIDIKPTPGKDKTNMISFSSRYLKEILNANAEQTDAVLKVSDIGLASIEFGNDTTEFYSKYTLIKMNIE